MLQRRIYDHATKTWGAWGRPGAETAYTTSPNYTYRVPDNLKNGDLVQFRICTINSWGQTSDWLTTSSVTIRGNQMWFKVNGVWNEADTYLKVNGEWKEATPYIKVNGIWKESV